ncbi:immunoglobulin superfamily DCC subclass member 3-like [Thalassophryne amazonica]|uniref:immunoglobulin superfamily DCC subclass member 3-like n=1 Tax=Thalassophryne amazonica TaxID=390379 RepID=UPI001471E541|nr:immunoglobulin superfamily DCC subclass member 3-like [Thalassophryne amazonica]
MIYRPRICDFVFLEAAAVYEVKVVAYNGNGESNCSTRLVSLAAESTSSGVNSRCQCRDGDASLSSIMVGIHIGTACIIFCVLFLMLGYRHSLFCSKATNNSWSMPRDYAAHPRSNSTTKDGGQRPAVSQVWIPTHFHKTLSPWNKSHHSLKYDHR